MHSSLPTLATPRQVVLRSALCLTVLVLFYALTLVAGVH